MISLRNCYSLVGALGIAFPSIERRVSDIEMQQLLRRRMLSVLLCHKKMN